MSADETKYFGRYQVLEEIGRGGMARVYKATDPELRREVAVKVMMSAASLFPAEAVERFQRELKSLAMVEHPNVVRIFDGGEANGQPYLVTELVEGTPLDRYIRENGKMDISRALQATSELLEALLAVHDAGLVHRDIKPSNLMVTPQGGMILMDFGIALAAFGDSLTRTGEVPGTLAYLPPECLGGNKATIESDLFQVGLISYEMLIGEPLFQLQSPRDFLAAHGDLPPSDLRERREEISEGMEKILRKALEPDPGQRYRRARHMLEAMTAEIRGARRRSRAPSLRSIKAAAPPRQQRISKAKQPEGTRIGTLIGLGGVLTCVAVMLALWAMGVVGFGPPPPPDRFDVTLTGDSLIVSWVSTRDYRGRCEINLGETGRIHVSESESDRSHRLRLPGAFEGVEFSVRVGAVSGGWSNARSVGR